MTWSHVLEADFPFVDAEGWPIYEKLMTLAEVAEYQRLNAWSKWLEDENDRTQHRLVELESIARDRAEA